MELKSQAFANSQEPQVFARRRQAFHFKACFRDWGFGWVFGQDLQQFQAPWDLAMSVQRVWNQSDMRCKCADPTFHRTGLLFAMPFSSYLSQTSNAGEENYNSVLGHVRTRSSAMPALCNFKEAARTTQCQSKPGRSFPKFSKEYLHSAQMNETSTQRTSGIIAALVL